MSALASPTSTSAITPINSRPLRERVNEPRRDMSAPGCAEDVTDAAHGVHQRWFGAVDLAPQVADVGLEDAGVPAEVVVPHVVEDLAAGEHAAGIDEQV